jgi:two-component system, OmpR family, response regulator
MNTPTSSSVGTNPSAKIFVVEDDAAVCDLIARTLIGYGFECERFYTGESLLHHIRVESPDFCIVDLGLPDMDGIEVVRQLSKKLDCGILILTGRGHTADRVMGLELGADDYMVKPFEERELVARVRSILRRRRAPGTPTTVKRYAKFLNWQLDCSANMLTAPDGTEHLLGTAETQVLKCFVEHPHQILTREKLMGDRDLSPLDRSIDVRISRLRKKIEEDAQNPKIIKTVYGAGYIFAASVSWH